MGTVKCEWNRGLGFLSACFLVGFQIEEHYAAKGVNIVGYFHANERFDDYELSGVAKNVGDHIYRYFPQAAILLVCVCIIGRCQKENCAWVLVQGFEFCTAYGFISLQLDNKKLEALPKGKDRSPVMQVSVLVLDICKVVHLPYFDYVMVFNERQVGFVYHAWLAYIFSQCHKVL